MKQRSLFIALLILMQLSLFSQTPTITSFTPASGPAGTLVTIAGTNLASPTAFTIGGVTALVISNTGTQLVGFVMPGAATGTVSVTTAGGTATGSSNFTVTATPYPGVLQDGNSGHKLVAGAGTPMTGSAVGVSADGNTAIAGGSNYSSGLGGAWIFTRIGTAWTNPVANLDVSGNIGNAAYGCSVAISADGNTAIVGGYADNSSVGAAWVWSRSSGSWVMEQKLVGSGYSGTSQQGIAVSLSADGNTAIVGGYGDNSGDGAVWVWTRSAGTWTQQGNKLVGQVSSGAGMGYSVSLSANGNTLIAGGLYDNVFDGAAWVYTRSGATWSQQQKLIGTGVSGSFLQRGTSVSISADGNTAAMGGVGNNSYIGSVWVFTRTGATWSQQQILTGTGYTGLSRQGRSVSLSADGNTLIEGGNTDSDPTYIGAFWAFTRSGTTWTQGGTKLIGSGYTGASQQGVSITLSADGSTGLIGGPNDNSNVGAAWVFIPSIPIPTITSFTPTSAGTGTTVTITGTNFTGATAVSFGGTAATSYSVVSATSITAVVASGTTGSVSVTTSGGTATLTGFTYNSTISLTATIGTASGNFTTLKAAFDAINAGTHKGVINIMVNSSTTESASAVLNASGTGSASYTAVNIYPTVTGLSISGSLNGTPLIDLDGADNVTIDGRVNQAGNKDLTLVNTNVSAGGTVSTIRFVNDASSNTVKYCNVKGITGTASGIIFFHTTTGSTGNDNNIIEYNDITNPPVSGYRPNLAAIYSLGSVSKENSGNIIRYNNIYDFVNLYRTTSGISIDQNNTTWTISGNSLYETTSIAPSGNWAYYGINIGNAGVNYTVSNNYIGGCAANCGGTAWTKTNAANNQFFAINLGIEEGTASNVQGNTITNFNWSNSGNYGWYGIFGNRWNTTASINIVGNTIGSADGSTSVSYTAGASIWEFIGIMSGSQGTVSVSGNTVANLNATASTAGMFAGVYFYGSVASSVSGNFIHNLTAGSTAELFGIKIVAGNTTYSNNIISLGDNTPATIYGIYETGVSGTNNLYFNTVYIGGTPTSGALNSYALYSAVTTNTRNFRNNIFDNVRSNNSATGKHYALYVVSSGGTLTCDYNDYLASGTGGMLGYYAGDKSALPIVTGDDVHSLNTNPTFASAGGTSASNYIPSAALAGVSGTGITTDYAGTTRAGTPTMGAYEGSTALTWDGSTDSDWNTAANWTPETVPTASANVTIPDVTNDPVVNQATGTPAVCNNLTITTGIVTIAPGKALTVNGTLTNNAGTTGLVIQSDATGTGSLLHNTADVNATIKRYIPGSSTLTDMVYHLVSVPLTPATSSTSNLFLGSYLYNFSESTNAWVAMGTPTTTDLDETRGYMVYYPGASQTYSFAGPMNSGSFTALTGYTDAAKGFNLVPNPYPSAIDWLASGWTKTNIENAVCVWNSATSTTNYASYVNGASTNGGSRYIAPGQAFFVHANNASPELKMGYNVRVHNSVSFMKSNENIPDLLKIHADAGTASDEIVVRFADGATSGFDGEWDAFKMTGGENAPQMSTMTADDIALAINSLPLSSEQVIVPLNFAFNATSDVSFTASGMESFNPATTIYLEDKALTKMVNLRQEPVYTFSYQSGSTSDRFILHFNGVTGVQENTTAVSGRAFISNGRIYLDVSSMQGQLASITVYNALGQIIRSQQQMINGISSIEAPLAKGIYIIHISTANQNFVTKVINK